jgi:putative glutamine amidotransferase
MNALPLIGLTGRRRSGTTMHGFPRELGDLDFDCFLAPYSAAVRAAGGLPVLLPFDIDPADYVEHLDGVVLTGGADIEPARYGDTTDPSRSDAEPERDAYEVALASAAMERSLPLLGICRGLQLVNVIAGGTLHQHVPEHARYDEPYGTVHEVVFEAASVLHGLYGDRRAVNSLHHQTIDRVGSGHRATGRAPDGTIEGIESGDGRIVCVQWHPEVMAGAATDPVFAWIVACAAAGPRRG